MDILGSNFATKMTKIDSRTATARLKAQAETEAMATIHAEEQARAAVMERAKEEVCVCAGVYVCV